MEGKAAGGGGKGKSGEEKRGSRRRELWWSSLRGRGEKGRAGAGYGKSWAGGQHRGREAKGPMPGCALEQALFQGATCIVKGALHSPAFSKGPFDNAGVLQFHLDWLQGRSRSD